jgi:hypothetical protein
MRLPKKKGAPRPVSAWMVPEVIHPIRPDFHIRFRGYVCIEYDSQKDVDEALRLIQKEIGYEKAREEEAH